MMIILFFVMLSDALLSAWVPGFLQDKLGGSLLMGLVISFQSIVGLAADLIFPELLKVTKLKRMLFYGAGLSVVYIALMYFSTFRPVILVFLAAMAVWGLYYEVLGFAGAQFVADTAAADERTKVWAVIGVFKSLAYFLGPVIVSLLVFRGNRVILVTAFLLTLVSVLLVTMRKEVKKEKAEEIPRVDVIKEASHWRVLIAHAWPVLLITLILGLIDAVFWTTGAVLGEKLGRTDPWGSLFLPAYMFPSLFVGFLMARWGLSVGKKKWGEVFVLLGGGFLFFLGARLPVWGYLGLVVVSSIMLSAAYPLIDAVYSDLIVRLNLEGKHLMGLTGSVVNLAYILGPAAAGYLSSVAGELVTFQLTGVLTIVVMVFLLIVTPRKIRLPQHEISKWE